MSYSTFSFCSYLSKTLYLVKLLECGQKVVLTQGAVDICNSPTCDRSVTSFRKVVNRCFYCALDGTVSLYTVVDRCHHLQKKKLSYNRWVIFHVNTKLCCTILQGNLNQDLFLGMYLIHFITILFFTGVVSASRPDWIVNIITLGYHFLGDSVPCL